MPEVRNIGKSTPFDNQRPFLGLRSFEEKHKSQFGGRDAEIKELFGQDENHGLTVVFGKSGIGKTSLIKAGLMPELRQNFYFPIYIRIDYSSSISPLEQLRKLTYEQMKMKDPNLDPVKDKTLWEYFHHVKLLDGLLVPVLILDQFEETFTLGDEKRRQVQELIVELSDLAENRIPLSVQKEYRAKGKTIPSRYAAQPYRVVLSLREDYLARLEELKRYMPSIMDNRFRVVQMTVSQAMDAAIKPGKGLIDESVAKEIIKKLPGVSQSDFDLLNSNGSSRQKLKVEPFLLSLICDRINERRIKKGLTSINLDLVSSFDVNRVIDSFYNETMEQYAPEVNKAIEDRLLTEGGFRKLQVLEELQQEYKISDEDIDTLVSARILRKEMRDGLEYVELIHDVLAPVIRKNRSKRIDKEREEQRRKALKRINERNRSKVRRIGVTVAFVFATALGFAIWNYNERKNIEESNAKLALARNMVFTAQSVGSNDASNEKAGIIARSAYLIYDKYKSKQGAEDIYAENFYNSMYRALVGMSVDKFQVATYSDGGIKTAIYNDSEERFICALSNGTVQNMANEIVLDFGQNDAKVTSMGQLDNRENHILAMAGTMDSVIQYDLNTNQLLKNIPIPGSLKGAKSLAFLSTGRLVLIQNTYDFVVGWDHPYDQPLRWHAREQFVWNDSTKTMKSIDEILKWGDSKLQLPDKKLSSIDTWGDSMVAIGYQDGIILLTEGKYLELHFSKARIGTVTALKFDRAGEFLVIGNSTGEVFNLKLDNYKIERHRYHVGKITDITFGSGDSLVATASIDGNVVLWNRQKNWNALPLEASKVLPIPLGMATKVFFSKEDDFVYAGYSPKEQEFSGVLLKWPTSMEFLSSLICEELNANTDLDEKAEMDQSLAELKEYFETNNLRLNEYFCNTNYQ